MKYDLTIQWTGNNGQGTKNYQSYSRNYSIIIEGKNKIQGSSDPLFMGDKLKHNPEELFLASIASCHMLWYLHLCADNGIVVIDYIDQATATLHLAKDGSGYFKEVILNPSVIVSDNSMIENALVLHKKANEFCFIANSCNFTIKHKPTCKSITS